MVDLRHRGERRHFARRPGTFEAESHLINVARSQAEDHSIRPFPGGSLQKQTIVTEKPEPRLKEQPKEEPVVEGVSPRPLRLEPQPEIRYAALGDFGYMFPRGDGILLGGTFERGVWDATPQADDIARIVSAQKRFFDGFRCTA